MSDIEYINRIESQNFELSEKLEKTTRELIKAKRKKGVYPVFKVIGSNVNGKWITEFDYITNCDSVDIIPNVIKFTLAQNKSDKPEKKENIIGFCFWRQSVNYRWALFGMRKFYDMCLKRVNNIEIDPETGKPVYTYS
jgi:hypothetical protein